jgi:hypothetical protein
METKFRLAETGPSVSSRRSAVPAVRRNLTELKLRFAAPDATTAGFRPTLVMVTRRTLLPSLPGANLNAGRVGSRGWMVVLPGQLPERNSGRSTTALTSYPPS